MVKPTHEFLSAVAAVVAGDAGGRTASRLCRPDCFLDAALLLCDADRVAIVTGFFIARAGRPETDGPSGAALLARAFLMRGRHPEVWTDDGCLPAVLACTRTLGLSDDMVKVCSGNEDVSSLDAVVFIERPGRAADGLYYNFRYEDISSVVVPLDLLSERAIRAQVPVVGIGDGGNEAGMGNLRDVLVALLPQYEGCLSVVPSTVALPVDVSNWGGYALTCVLSALWGEWCGHREGEESRMLRAMVGAGTVDGITLQSQPTVDGMSLEVHEAVARRLRTVYGEIE